MPLDGFRWSCDSDSALCDMRQTNVLGRAGGRDFQNSQLDRRSLVRSVSHPLPISESCTSSPSAYVSINGGNGHNSHELPANFSVDRNCYKDGTGQQHFELSVVCQTRINKILNWVGIHSLEVYLIHGFSLCLLKRTNPLVLDSCYD